MKTRASIWILLHILFLNMVLAEGTKEFRPTEDNYGNLQINDKARPFAMESNTNPLHRLYFTIANTSEKVYLGFNHVGTGSATFRIKRPNGTTAYSRTTVPTSGNGYITSYAQAVAGPKIGGTPANGYTPITFSPDMTGNFYIEFTTSLSGAYHFDLFDITVTTASYTPIPGRLWSYAWDLNTRSYDNRYYGKFYVYSDDGFVTELNMNGIQPFGFVVSCNNSGTSNTTLGDIENRKSITGNSTRPQYKLFLNNPDINLYPSSIIPEIIDNISLIGDAYYNEPLAFSIHMNIPGVVEMLVDLNNIPGYQPNTEDVLLVEAIHAGPDTIIWDSKNGFGEWVTEITTTVNVTTSFYAGITHFPIFDPETHYDGFYVNKIRPLSDSAPIYWDDSNFVEGTTNSDGSLSSGHSWGVNFGDERTMNTWWYGFELNELNTFTIEWKMSNLPIELIYFTGKSIEQGVLLEWATASEINSDYFTIERSIDLFERTAIYNTPAAGNSHTKQTYRYTDTTPSTGNNYYTLKQVDFDGKYTEHHVVVKASPSISNEHIIVSNEEHVLYINITESAFASLYISVYDISGIVIYRQEVYSDTGSYQIKIPIASYHLQTGIIQIESARAKVTKKWLIL